MMPTQRNYQFGVAILLLLVFTISSASVFLTFWTTFTISSPLIATAVIASLLSLYGFYKLMSTFVEANRPDNPTAN
jgi:hypothetical protein